jgi:hypothetical protein
MAETPAPIARPKTTMPSTHYPGVVCRNGHKIGIVIVVHEPRADFCPKCGEECIANCPSCGEWIRSLPIPVMVSEWARKSDRTDWTLGDFCTACGKPYPWREARVAAANERLDLLEELYPEERDLLKQSLPDLLTETPRTEVAVLRWKKALGRVTKPGKDVLYKVFVDVAAKAISTQLNEGH